MRKRLLFVDDEANILAGLRRALHGMRSEWEMNFVDSADAALHALEQENYDAIVTDMRMPVMDGAELLEVVKKTSPGCNAHGAFGAVEPGRSTPLDRACTSVPVKTLQSSGTGATARSSIRDARSSGEPIPEDNRLALAVDPEPAHNLR